MIGSQETAYILKSNENLQQVNELKTKEICSLEEQNNTLSEENERLDATIRYMRGLMKNMHFLLKKPAILEFDFPKKWELWLKFCADSEIFFFLD